MDLVDGKPTGSVRISFGYMSTLEDAKEFVLFVEQNFRDCSGNLDRVCIDTIDQSNGDVMGISSDMIGRKSDDVMAKNSGDVIGDSKINKREFKEGKREGEGGRRGVGEGEGGRGDNREEEGGKESKLTREKGVTVVRVGDQVTATSSDNPGQVSSSIVIQADHYILCVDTACITHQ